MNTDNPERGWMLDTILTGLQKLLLLSLDRSPAAESISGVAQTWLEAIVTNRTWYRDTDQPRFEQAFITLERTAKRWPAPAELLEAMPRPPEQARLSRPTRIPETRDARCQRLRMLLGLDYNPAVADPDYDPTQHTLRPLVSPDERRAAEEALARTHPQVDAEEVP